MGRLASFSDALQLDSEELSSIPAGPASGVGESSAEGSANGHPPDPEKAAAQAAIVDQDTVEAEEGSGPDAAADEEIAPEPVEGEVPAPEEAAAPAKPKAKAATAKTGGAASAAAPKTSAAKAPARKRAVQPTPEPEPEVQPVNDKARWTQLQRKEFRMHNVQADLLATLTRKVNRASPRDPDERVTDNTLIRVGLALLLELHRDDLRGKNERELRESVGLPPELPEED